jgi:hypothetical protein
MFKRLFLCFAVVCLCPALFAQSYTNSVGLEIDSSGNIMASMAGGSPAITNSFGFPLDSSGNLMVDCQAGCSAGAPGGSANQVQYKINGTTFGGFTFSGDCTVVVSTGAITCTKTNGAAFSGLATLTESDGNVAYGTGGAWTASSAPAISAANMTSFPTLNQNTTGMSANLSGSQTANFVYAAPNGSNGTGAFRALVGADVPTLNQSTTGNAATATNATEVGGITITGTPAVGYVPTATSSSAATWQQTLHLKWFQNGASGNGFTLASSNTAYLGLLVVPATVQFTSIYYNVNTLDATSTDHYDIGIYSCTSLDCSQTSTSASLVCDTGAIAQTATGTFVTACEQGGTITIQPGTYMIAVSGSATTAKFGYGAAPGVPFTTISLATGLTGGALGSTATTPSTAGSVASSVGGIYVGLH